MGEDPLEGDVGERAGDVGEVLAEGGDVVDDLLFAISFEIGVAELARGEDGVDGDVAGEGAFVEGAAGEDADVVGGAGGEEVLEGGGVEDIEDDLDGIDEAGFEEGEGGVGLVIVDGDAEVFDLARGFEGFDAAAPVVGGKPFRVPDVKLLEVDLFDTEVTKAFVGGGQDVIEGEDVGDGDAGLGGPDAVFGGDFGADPDAVAGEVADDLADEFFRVSFVIGEGGIDEIQAEIEGAAEGGEGLGIVAAEPLAASDAPGAVADFTDFDAGPTEFT